MGREHSVFADPKLWNPLPDCNKLQFFASKVKVKRFKLACKRVMNIASLSLIGTYFNVF